jgi:CubicO group peptidase (beta-lactamase class C family)
VKHFFVAFIILLSGISWPSIYVQAQEEETVDATPMAPPDQSLELPKTDEITAEEETVKPDVIKVDEEKPAKKIAKAKIKPSKSKSKSKSRAKAKPAKPKKAKPKKEKNINFSALIKKAEKLQTGTLLIIRNGKFLVEKNWESPLSFYYLQGITPSVVTLAVGSLLDEGKLGLDHAMMKWIPEWIDPKGQVTVQQLLNHTSGFLDNEAEPWYKAANTWAWARLQNIADEPGDSFEFSETNFVLLGFALSKTIDKPVEDLVAKTIFRPLMIQKVGWDEDKFKHTNVVGGLRIRNYDLLKIGNLIADNGIWNGKRVVSEEWIKQIQTPSEKNTNYGLGWWIQEAHGIKALHAFGHQGQHLVVIPEKKIVAIRLRNLVPVEQNKEEFDWNDFPKELLDLVK